MGNRILFYTLYERLWHWVQAVCGVVLLVSGFSIAFPELRLSLGFETSVTLHHIAAWTLVINAALALFYNLAGGLIRRYVPRADEIFRLSMHHARYYLLGIFRGEPHPFHKTPERRLLPLQKIAYFLVLNLVLPVLAITGLLKLFADDLHGLIGVLGGMPVISSIHRFAAWLMAAFVVLHVYMTTTGTHWWSSLRTMITGYEEAEKSDEETRVS